MLAHCQRPATNTRMCRIRDEGANMTRKDADPRARRTRQMLCDALIDLVSERGFDAVTVGDIAARAGVNRATFYRHYQDKYDLVARIFEDEVAAMGSALGSPEIGLEDVDPEQTPVAWVRLFEHFARH